jgi:hypothetical protein
MRENLCQLFIRQEINIENIKRAEIWTSKEQIMQLTSRQTSWTDSSPKMSKWPTNTWRNVSIFSHIGNANQNWAEIPPHPSRHDHYQENKQQMLTSYTVGGNVNQWSHYGNQYGISPKIL